MPLKTCKIFVGDQEKGWVLVEGQWGGCSQGGRIPGQEEREEGAAQWCQQLNQYAQHIR